MKIQSIIGSTEEEVLSKKFNIFIPISLGNKWFIPQNIQQYILWALKVSKSDIIIVVADKLHQINIEVKDRYNPKRAEKKALRISSEKIQQIQEIIDKFDFNEKKRISIISWGDINQDKLHIDLLSEVYIEFKKNSEFRDFILSIVRDSVKKIQKRVFSEDEIMSLSRYVLNELPVLLYGINYKGSFYNLHPYPSFTKIFTLADEMQKGKFSELYSRMHKPKSVIVELR